MSLNPAAGAYCLCHREVSLYLVALILYPLYDPLADIANVTGLLVVKAPDSDRLSWGLVTLTMLPPYSPVMEIP